MVRSIWRTAVPGSVTKNFFKKLWAFGMIPEVLCFYGLKWTSGIYKTLLKWYNSCVWYFAETDHIMLGGIIYMFSKLRNKESRAMVGIIMSLALSLIHI